MMPTNFSISAKNFAFGGSGRPVALDVAVKSIKSNRMQIMANTGHWHIQIWCQESNFHFARNVERQVCCRESSETSLKAQRTRSTGSSCSTDEKCMRTRKNPASRVFSRCQRKETTRCESQHLARRGQSVDRAQKEKRKMRYFTLVVAPVTRKKKSQNGRHVFC